MIPAGTLPCSIAKAPEATSKAAIPPRLTFFFLDFFLEILTPPSSSFYGLFSLWYACPPSLFVVYFARSPRV